MRATPTKPPQQQQQQTSTNTKRKRTVQFLNQQLKQKRTINNPNVTPRTTLNRVQSILTYKQNYIDTLESTAKIQHKYIHKVRMYKQEIQKTNSVQSSFNQKIEKEKLVRLDPTGLMLGSKSHRSKLELGQSLKVNEQQVHKIREHNKQPLLRLLVDSGSTINVITDERHFSKYTLTTNSTRQHVKDAGGHVHHTKGHGTVTGIVHGINGREEILIHAVHIPTFSINILSTNMMRKIGYSIILPTSRLGYTETPSHNKITHGTYSDGLEYLELNTESTCTSQMTAEPSHKVHASMHKGGGESRENGTAKNVRIS